MELGRSGTRRLTEALYSHLGSMLTHKDHEDGTMSVTDLIPAPPDPAEGKHSVN